MVRNDLAVVPIRLRYNCDIDDRCQRGLGRLLAMDMRSNLRELNRLLTTQGLPVAILTHAILLRFATAENGPVWAIMAYSMFWASAAWEKSISNFAKNCICIVANCSDNQASGMSKMMSSFAAAVLRIRNCWATMGR